ncbi:hypothetical protein BGZ95_000217 [Linnemannia exigua]|uniref:Inhibitor I9 domain-containing protein n=1 Tax=Linnemannia exigua TaxID=604196 RepID=A0AAD4H4K8_9FUNG|nr:hypothetical protein BGZ95_000217 [Linnemannia exigua]
MNGLTPLSPLLFPLRHQPCSPPIASLALPKANHADKAHNKVIVVFKDGTDQKDITKAENDVIAQGGEITQRYTSALLGFAASLPDNSVQALNIHPRVNYIEADGPVSAYTKNLIGA